MTSERQEAYCQIAGTLAYLYEEGHLSGLPAHALARLSDALDVVYPTWREPLLTHDDPQANGS